MLPEHAPFTSDQRDALNSVFSSLSPVQRGWLSGFLAAGGDDLLAPSTGASVAPAQAAGKLMVLYGTESGNSEELADRTVKAAKKRGFKTALKNMSDLAPADLAEVENLLVIVSTWGDGEPPETAALFFNEFMESEVKLSGVRYSVCALGDTSYEKFCQTGRDIDKRLAALGGMRVADCQECDVEYEEDFKTWQGLALGALAPADVAGPVAAPVSAAEPGVGYGKKNPFPSEILESVMLNGEGSIKETLHLELSLDGSGMSYEPGDALAVLPVNAPDVVAEILEVARLDGDEEVDVKAVGRKRLADSLRDDLDITALSRNVLVKLSKVANSGALAALVADDAKEKLKEYVNGRQIVDAIREFAPSGLSAGDLAGVFRKLPPRLYSIASSPLAHPDEVHLTVSAVRYQSHDRVRKGVCSTYLADMVETGSKVRVFVQPNKNFRLPSDASAPVIMVGPGTGIAPFRSFIEHREELGCTGESWLFMGDQHYTYDFLYQLEWQDHLKKGSLTRLDVAFSRDQPEKIYVQHRMKEHGADLYAWLEEGAHFYVCGDVTRMAADVHEALVSIVEENGGKSRKAAEAYVEDLKKSKRYHRDVY